MTVMVAITSAGYDDLRLLPGDQDVLYFVAAILIAPPEPGGSGFTTGRQALDD